jgi:O-Antigen ligase
MRSFELKGSYTCGRSAPRLYEAMFLVFVATLPIMRPMNMQVFGSLLYLADGVFALAFVAWLWDLANGRVTLAWGRTFYLLLALYLAACLISSALSTQPQQTWKRLLVELYLALIAILAFNVMHTTRETPRRVTLAWIAGGVVTSMAVIAGAILFYTGHRHNALIADYGSLPAGNYPRASGPFLNFNMACNYLSIVAVLLLTARQCGWISRRVCAWAVTIVFVAAAFTVSPGLGGLALGVGLWLYAARGNRLAWWTGIVAASAFYAATFVSPIAFVTAHRLEASPRLLCWKAAAKVWEQHPATGVGTGLDIPCPPWQGENETQHLGDAHNLFLNVAATKGTIGIATLLLLVAYVIRKPVASPCGWVCRSLSLRPFCIRA